MEIWKDGKYGALAVPFTSPLERAKRGRFASINTFNLPTSTDARILVDW